MSGRYPRLLEEMARRMYRLAGELLQRGDYDLTALHSGYAAQLAIKALLYRLTGEEWRGHSIRQLLAVLAYSLRRQGSPGKLKRWRSSSGDGSVV